MSDQPEVKIKKATIKRSMRTYQCHGCGVDLVVGEDSLRIIGMKYDKHTGGWPCVASCSECDDGKMLHEIHTQGAERR